MKRLIYFLRLARPLFLVGGFVFYGLGIAIAIYESFALNWPSLLLGQLAVTATQLMTHFSNDYFDLVADRANRTPTRWSGGSRVLAEDLLPPQIALGAALFCAVVFLVTVIVLAQMLESAGWSVFLLLLSFGLAWAYSAPPFRFHSRGLGEVTVALIVPVLTPLVGFTIQAGQPALLPVLVSIPLAFLQAAMILMVNFPDAVGDLNSDKQTLVIRLGPKRAARLYCVLLASVYLSLPFLVLVGLPLIVATSILLPLPLAGWLIWRMARGEWRHSAARSGLGFWSIGLLMATAGLELVALLTAALSP